MSIKFGAKQLNNPTPKFLKLIFRAYTFLAGLWVLLNPHVAHLPEAAVAEINKWLLLGVPIIQYVIKFFGLDYDMSGQGADKPSQFQPNTAFQVNSYYDKDAESGLTCHELASLAPDEYVLIEDDNGNPNLCIYAPVPVQRTFINHINQSPYVLTSVDFVGGRPVGR